MTAEIAERGGAPAEVAHASLKLLARIEASLATINGDDRTTLDPA